MKIKFLLKKLVVGSIPLFLLAGCGGGSSGGGGGTVPKANLNLAVVNEETAHEAAAVGLMLDEQLTGIIELAEMAGLESDGGMYSRSIAPQAVRIGAPPRYSKTYVLGRIGNKLNLPLPAQAGRTLQPRNQSFEETILCEEKGTMKLTGDESSFTLRFSNCTSSFDWGDGDYDRDTMNGSVTFSEDSWSGYALAYKLTTDLNVKTEEIWDGEKGSGEITLKGSMTYGANNNEVGLKIDQYDLAGKGKDGDGPWDIHFWIREYSATVNFDDQRETVKYAGKAGARASEAKLDGTLEIKTDKALHYEYWPDTEFARGEAVNVVGANEDTLRVEFAQSGMKATVLLNERIHKEFTSFDEFECWIDGDC